MTPSNDRGELDAGSASLAGLNILIVEDSWHIASALKSLLRALGAGVAGPAATTAEAEQIIAAQAPDVAIVDFNLRGGELADGLIDRLHARGIRVIVISGYASVPLRTDQVVVLQKPIVEAQLLAALQPVVERKPSRRSTT